MKKIYTLFLLAGLAAAGCSKEDEGSNRDVTNDFDPLFALELQSRGYIDNAAYITPAQVEAIETLNVSGNDSDYGTLTSLQGIEYFTSLTSLSCSSNRLTSLNVSSNTALTELQCSNNQLTELNVSNNTALTILNCNNNLLATLNVSNNVKLDSLACSGNQLQELNVSNNTALTKLHCSNNVKHGKNEQGKPVEYRLSSLVLSSALETLTCDQNFLSSLDLSPCTALKTLSCSASGVGVITLSKNAELTELYCSDNYLSALDISQNTKLTKLYCHDNRLQSLDISKNKELVELQCERNVGNTTDDNSIFNVSAWFDDNAIPASFTTGTWTCDVLKPDGSLDHTYTVTIKYDKVE